MLKACGLNFVTVRTKVPLKLIEGLLLRLHPDLWSKTGSETDNNTMEGDTRYFGQYVVGFDVESLGALVHCNLDRRPDFNILQQARALDVRCFYRIAGPDRRLRGVQINQKFLGEALTLWCEQF